MRRTIIIAAAASLGFGTGVATAQDNGAITQRVDRLEGQMPAGQRKGFPAGSAQWVQPPITPAATTPLAGRGATHQLRTPPRRERGGHDVSTWGGAVSQKNKQQ